MSTDQLQGRWSLTTLGARWRRKVLGIPLIETSCSYRGFQVASDAVRARLEHVGQTFVYGYHTALDNSAPEVLVPQLQLVGSEWRGFAFEGAAMALALCDQLTPWQQGRWSSFTAGAANHHLYMALVGAGWAFARLTWLTQNYLNRFDPLLRWLVIDGYGFHEGYFHPNQSIARQSVPARLSGYARRAFDQGLGRSLWFRYGADVALLPAQVAAFPAERQADLWSGVGLAAAYAGGAERCALYTLVDQAGPYQGHLAQGAAFAAQARRRAHNPTAQIDEVCAVFCRCSAEQAALVTEQALVELPFDQAQPAYEIWRQRIRDTFAKEAPAS
ncbi:MAG: DUF1702 family protein [Roseiflexaceae bacterium]